VLEEVVVVTDVFEDDVLEEVVVVTDVFEDDVLEEVVVVTWTHRPSARQEASSTNTPPALEHASWLSTAH